MRLATASFAASQRCLMLKTPEISTTRATIPLTTNPTPRNQSTVDSQVAAPISTPSTAITAPVSGSITGAKPETQVPQRSTTGPSVAGALVTNTPRKASLASP